MPNEILLREDRQLIPRWHTSRKSNALQYPTLMPVTKKLEDVKDHWLEESRRNWRKQPSILNAVELNSSLFLHGLQEDPDYLSTLNYMLARFDDLPTGVADAISKKIKYVDDSNTYSTNLINIRSIIRRLKSTLRFTPRDAMTWMDLGFYYAVLDEDDKASHCLKIGWNLQKNHPYICRSYARYLVHKDNPEKALWILRKNEGIKTNPLISSAAIAISSAFDLTGTKVSDGVKLLKSYSGEPAFSSELGACIATIEFRNGNIRKAKKLFDKALFRPSENALSQYGWLQNKYGFTLGEACPLSRSSIESSVNKLYVNCNFRECREKLVELHNFQPFSDASLTDAGYISMIALNDPCFVLELSNNRVPKAHMGFGELNNLIVAKLMLNDLSSIESDMQLLITKSRISDGDAKGVLYATSGMWMYKIGKLQEGKRFYEDSIEFFTLRGAEKGAALARHFYSKHVKDLEPEVYNRLRKSVESAAKKHKMKELIFPDREEKMQ